MFIYDHLLQLLNIIIKPNEILCIELHFQNAEYVALLKIFSFINNNDMIYSLSDEKGNNLDRSYVVFITYD